MCRAPEATKSPGTTETLARGKEASTPFLLLGSVAGIVLTVAAVVAAAALLIWWLV